MAKNRLLVNHEQDLIQLSWQPRQAAPSFAPAVSFKHPFDTQAHKRLSMDSLLVCVCPTTFDKVRLVRQLGQLEDKLLEQAQNILRRYLSFE